MGTQWDDLVEGDAGPPPLVVGPLTVDLELVCAKQDGSVAVQGWMTFVVPA